MEQRSARTTEQDQRGAREAGQVRAARRPERPDGEPRLPAPARTAGAPDPGRRRGGGDRPDGRDPSDRRDRRDRGNRPRASEGARDPGPGKRRPVRTTGPSLSRLPAPRLTGLGTGVFATLLMIAAGGLEGLLFDGAPAFYGTVFVLVCVASALWVRPRELFAAPVAAPLAYTIGQFFAGGPGDGVSGVLQNVFTSLALHAVWLYAGTLTAALLVLTRKAVLGVLRRRAKNAQHRPRNP
ncbi:DUF6542 domain-containing protein [Streptomyces iconiensis]|uniref:DUF6542 domain-containing protein n=1 Tax=Streptomyces iconiensis TaxID=1384038 RepID=A0ABT6ZZZ8_9ACTN|nr:DUF6542 domain-containing protein [Streptomyces iconiensis]MDJ1134658.1 hypothetical protein [Streptomyces iconiensis]